MSFLDKEDEEESQGDDFGIPYDPEDGLSEDQYHSRKPQTALSTNYNQQVADMEDSGQPEKKDDIVAAYLQHMGQTPLLTPDEERMHAKRMSEAKKSFAAYSQNTICDK